MNENLRALAFILVLTVPVLVLARRPMCGLAMNEDDFVRRRALWIGLTVAAFVLHDFWLYALVAVLALAFYGSKDSNPLALFLVLLFAVPSAIVAKVSGLGLINFLVDVNHIRILSLVLLLPVCMKARLQANHVPFGRTLADLLLISYLALELTLQGLTDSVTNTARSAVYAWIDVLLPYYAASRTIRSVRQFRDVFMALVLAAALLAVVAMFEYVKNWLLYWGLAASMGLGVVSGQYLMRGDALRAIASTGHALVLGYVMMMSIGLYWYASRAIQSKAFRGLGWAVLLTGLLVTWSRGPWLGTVFAALVILLTGPQKLRHLGRASAVGIPVLAMVLVSPMGGKLIDMLPWVGSVDEFSVTYRQRLFDVSIDVILANPVFGSFDYLALPEMRQLIQGEGIIDIVNSYIGVALSYGLTGLALFVGFFASVAWPIKRALRANASNEDVRDLGRALLATLLAVLFTIATVSSIGAIPTLYWILAGLCVAYRKAFGRVPGERPVDARSVADHGLYGRKESLRTR